jgi:hypothetical protein
MQVPGSSEFLDWAIGTTFPSGTFIPDDGPGTYRFRSRLRSTEGPATDWSPPVSIVAN